MKLPFFRKPVRYIPSQQEGSLQDFRERILSILLTSAVTLGALAFVAALVPALRTRQYASIIIYSICYVWILIVTLQKQRLTYTVKIYSLLFLFYLLGITNLIQNGLTADAGVFLLAFTIMTSLMIGPRSGVLALVFSLGAYTLVGVLMTSGTLVPPILTNYREPMDWLSGGSVIILLSTIFVLSLNTILHGLNESIAKVRALAIDADRDRDQLRQRSQDLHHRLAQLRAVADIEHTISAVLEPEDLLQKVVDLLGERFGLYFVGVFLLDDAPFDGAPSNGAPSSSEASTVHPGEAALSDRSDLGVSLQARKPTSISLQASTDKTIPRGYKLPLSENMDADRRMLSASTNQPEGDHLPSGVRWAVLNHKPQAVDVNTRKDAFTATYLPLARTELALPLISHDRAIGVLMIYSTQANAFDGDDIALFQSSSESLATALENARLFKQTQADLEEIRALQRQYISRTWAEVEQIHGNLSYTYLGSTPEQYPVDLRTTVDLRTPLPPEAGLELQDQPLAVSGGPSNGAPSNGEFTTYNTPINLRDQTIGQITLETNKPAWSNEERAFIESVITEAALALENARLLEEIRSRAQQEQLIGQVSAQFQGSLDMDAVLRAAVRQLGQLPGVSEASIHIRPETIEN